MKKNEKKSAQKGKKRNTQMKSAATRGKLTISATDAAYKYCKMGKESEYTAIDAMANLSDERRREMKMPRLKRFKVKMGRCSSKDRRIDIEVRRRIEKEATDFVNKIWNDVVSSVSFCESPRTDVRCGTTESVIEYQAMLLSNALETAARLGIKSLDARFCKGRVEFSVPGGTESDLIIIAERLERGESHYSKSMHHFTRDKTSWNVSRSGYRVVVEYSNA